MPNLAHLYAAHITFASLEDGVIFHADLLCPFVSKPSFTGTGLHYTERIQTPTASISDQTQNRGEVIREDNWSKYVSVSIFQQSRQLTRCKPATVNETGDLEKLLFLSKKLSFFSWNISFVARRVSISSPLVNLHEFLRNVLSFPSVLAQRGGCKESLTLWLRLKRTKRAQTAGGRRSSLSSAKTSG